MANLDIIIKATDQASGTIRNVSGSLDDLGNRGSRALGKVGGLLGSGLKVAAGVGVGALAGVGAGLAKAAFDGFGLNSTLEDTRAQLVAFTKDGAVADQMLADIRAEAAKTPFAFQELASATASLFPAAKASGLEMDSLIKTAEILAASNPGQGLEGAAFSLREALSGDFVSIIDRFNLPRQRLNELKDEGVPAIEAITIAMQEMGLDASLVSGMAETMTGRWSTFKDSMDTVKASLAAPIFDLVKEGLSSLQPLIDANMPRLQELATTIGQGVADAVKLAVEWVGNLRKVWEEDFGWLRDFVGVAMEKVRAIIDKVTTIISRIWGDHGDDTMGIVDGYWQYIKDVVQFAMDTVLTILDVALAILEGDWTAAWEGVVSIAEGAWDLLKSAWTNVLAAIWELIKNIDWLALGRSIVEGIGAGITAGASVIWDALMGAIGSAWQGAKDFLGIRSPSTLFADLGKQTMAGFAGGINAGAYQPALAMQGAAANTYANTYNMTFNGGGSPTDTAYAVQDAILRTQRRRGY